MSQNAPAHLRNYIIVHGKGNKIIHMSLNNLKQKISLKQLQAAFPSCAGLYVKNEGDMIMICSNKGYISPGGAWDTQLIYYATDSDSNEEMEEDNFSARLKKFNWKLPNDLRVATYMIGSLLDKLDANKGVFASFNCRFVFDRFKDLYLQPYLRKMMADELEGRKVTSRDIKLAYQSFYEDDTNVTATALKDLLGTQVDKILFVQISTGLYHRASVIIRQVQGHFEEINNIPFLKELLDHMEDLNGSERRVMDSIIELVKKDM